MEGCIVKAVFDFPKETDSDLALNVGDIVKVVKQINDEWYVGTTNNETGQFPAAFVKIALKNAPSHVYMGIADFLGDEIGDIQLQKGDILGLKEEVDDHWVVGKSDTSEGLCPRSFLEEIRFIEIEPGYSEESSNEDGYQEVSFGESIDAFTAQSSEELTFPKGARVVLIRELDSFWTEGVFDGKKGKFPSLFVKVVTPLPTELQFRETDSQGIQESSNEAIPSAKALYFYVGANSDELSFDKGELITLIEKVNEEWYKGKIGKSLGLFPANHVEILVDLPYESCNELHLGSQKQSDEDDKSKQRIDKGGKSKEEQGRKVMGVEKPSLKPKPQIIPTGNETINRTKPLLLKSSKSNQRNQIPKQKSEGVTDKLLQSPHEEKKALVLKNEDTKAVGKPAVATKIRNSEKPNRPPSVSVPNGELISEQVTKLSKNEVNDKRSKPNAIERPPRPKSIKHTVKLHTLENDMPLFSSNRNVMKSDLNKRNKAKVISPNVKLLESELNSVDLKTDLKSTSNSTFFVSIDKNLSYEEGLDDKVQKKTWKVKRPAPKRPEGHPSRDISFNEGIHLKGESLSPKLLRRETQARGSPSGSPHLSRTNDIEKKPVARKAKPLSSLPKPLAPQPPQRPLGTPKGQTKDMTLQSPFQLHDTFESGVVNGNIKTSPHKQEFKGNGMGSSSFYVDYLAHESADGKDFNLESQDIETVEQKIVLIKGQIESESTMLSGIEKLLKHSEDEDKRKELMSRQRTLSSSLMDLNEELFAYQDEKSYLLASCGDVNAIKCRIDDLSKQIESYKDNGAKLRRMKDVARTDEVVEIKDGIEFCDHMVETLSDEIVSLRKKIEKEDEVQEEDPLEVRRRLLSQRQKAIRELIKTEEDYHRDIELCSKRILPQLMQSKVINCDKIFGNLTEICSLSSRLLDSLKKLETEEGEGICEKIGQCFVQICHDLEMEYSKYCRNYDESQSLLEKLEQDVEQRDEIFNAVTTLRDETGLWDLSSYLIKPVQRILKYPLILQEIHKFSPEDDPDRESIQQAIRILRNVAIAINEFKRRKDLVQKYQKTEGIGNKIQRLNWHSVRKKSSRINQKITQFTGLVSQTVDETFVEEEKRFRAIEKLIKNFNRNIALYLEFFQESNNMQKIVVEDIKMLSSDTFIQNEVDAFYNVIVKVKDAICPKFVSSIKSRVFDPLDRLLQLFQSPMKLIEKRQDKCLDYDRLLNRAQKNKDTERSRQFADELNMAKNNYEALNSQLLEELPRLSGICLNLVKSCLSNFIEARRFYLSELTEEIKLTFQLHLIDRYSNVEVLQKHAESLFMAAEKISHLIFYPEKFATSDGLVKSDPTPFSRENFSTFYADVLFDQNESDPTSPIKPSTPDLDDYRKNEPCEATRPIPLPRRCSMRKSSGSNSSSPAKSTAQFLDATTLEKDRERQFSSGDRASFILDESDEVYVVDYTFEKEDAAELSVEEGVLVKVIRKHDKEGNSEWWLVQTAQGRGYVPSSYLKPSGKVISAVEIDNKNSNVDIKHDMVTDDSEGIQEMTSYERLIDDENRTVNYVNKDERSFGMEDLNPVLDLVTSLGNSSDTNMIHRNEVMYRVLYDFQATEQEETSVEEGELVTVMKVGDDSGNDEWCYVESKGKQGYVPFNYLEPVNGIPS